MPLQNILKRASNIILGSHRNSDDEQETTPPYYDGEVVFCKNNVCVHPPALLRQEYDIVHYPGYLSISVHIRNQESQQPTLLLSWIPNTTLKASPWTVEKRSSQAGISSDGLSWPGTEEPVWDQVVEFENDSISLPTPRRASNDSASLWETPDVSLSLGRRLQCLQLDESRPSPTPSIQHPESLSRSESLTSSSSLLDNRSLGPEELPTWLVSPEMLALQHNLTFPESVAASPVVRRRSHKCRRFTVDLSEMRSLRLFSSGGNGNGTNLSGQLVVASRESQYKILHFHHGGLQRLGQVLTEWSCLLRPQPGTDAASRPYQHFMVCRPEVSQEELHPEEGRVPPVSPVTWQHLLTPQGQLQDDLALRKAVFFGGLDPCLRSTVWPFLLKVYSYQSTWEEREQQLAVNRQKYAEITNILLNYALSHPEVGYTQGMSDLLAPLMTEIHYEADSYWCFVNLMQKMLFVCTPTDSDMDLNLSLLKELIRVMQPTFYSHLQRHTDAMELLFTHRWILLCFKREFSEGSVLRMWEACWANYLTDYFHLFLSLAIVCVYGDDVAAQDLRTDEMLLHFSSLAMHMDGEIILRKARGLLYQFRRMPIIPCSLRSLCQHCGPGVWDSTHVPDIECIHEDQVCPHST